MSEFRSNFIDECCFGPWLEKDRPDHQSPESDIEQPLNSNTIFKSTFNSNEDLNFIDSQYFYAPTSASSESSLSSASSTWSSDEDDSLNFIDSQYFVKPSSPNATFLTPEVSSPTIISRNFHTASRINSAPQNSSSHRDSGSTEFSPLKPDRDSLPPIVSVGSSNRRSPDSRRQQKPKRRLPEVEDQPINASEALPSESAAEMVQRLRREGSSSAVDSKGFRLYRREDFTAVEHMTREQLVQYLVRECLIYADDQLVALNKPYGLHVTRTLF